jgi:hypothetical protein
MKRPRLSVTTGRDLLPVLEGLATSDTRTASQMARRLVTEALSARGLWDLENNWPTRDARRLLIRATTSGTVASVIGGAR